MRDQIRQRILDWHYLDRGSLEEIIDDMLPSQHHRYRWTIYHSLANGKYVLCADLVNLTHGEVEKAFASAAESHPVDSLYAVHFTNQVVRIFKAAD